MGHSERSLRSRGIPENARLHQMRGTLRKVCEPPCAAGVADVLDWVEARRFGFPVSCALPLWVVRPRAVEQPTVSRDSSAPQTPLGMTDLEQRENV